MKKIRCVKVIKKWRFDDMGDPLTSFWGIEIFDNRSGDVFRPTYPFSDNVNSLALQEFIGLYEKDLLDFYVNGWNYSFGTFVHKDRENDTKDKFRDFWFKKGVVFY